MLAALCASTMSVKSQLWDTNGNGAIIPGTNFLGTTNSVPIDFRTDNIFRARINRAVTYPTLKGFNSVVADGFTLLSPNASFLASAPYGPFSRLHLADGTRDTQNSGYRPWQRTGGPQET